MKSEYEQVLNKAFDCVKIAASKPGSFGTFGISFEMADGAMVLVRRVIEEREKISREAK